jgi:ribosome maturation factor RimP
MPSTALTPDLLAELAAVAEAHGCELLHAEFRGGTLRIFLDREGGVRLEDCESVSKEVSPVLDVVDFGRGRYTLEVSSPGLDRQLYGPRDWERFGGRRIRVRFVDPTTGRRATVVGKLVRFSPESQQIELSEMEARSDLVLRLADVEQARLEPEL